MIEENTKLYTADIGWGYDFIITIDEVTVVSTNRVYKCKLPPKYAKYRKADFLLSIDKKTLKAKNGEQYFISRNDAIKEAKARFLKALDSAISACK